MCDRNIQRRTVLVKDLPSMDLNHLRFLTRTVSPEEDQVEAIVYRENGCEITFQKEITAMHFIENGFDLQGEMYATAPALQCNAIVTLTEVPYCILNDSIIRELQKYGYSAVGTMQRTQVHGIETGERKIAVVYNGTNKSIPSTIFVADSLCSYIIKIRHKSLP